MFKCCSRFQNKEELKTSFEWFVLGLAVVDVVVNGNLQEFTLPLLFALVVDVPGEKLYQKETLPSWN